MKYRAYPHYKPSDVAELGEVPEHWGISRVDAVATVKGRLGWKGLTADEYVDEGFLFLATPNIKGEGEIDFQNVNFITEERYEESPEIMLQQGDILLAKDGSTLGITNIVRHLPRPATVNSSIAVLRPRASIHGPFLFRWFTSSFMQSSINRMKDGQGVPHLFQADIRKFAIPSPPHSEQRVIAAFLDRETAKIDALVAKKRRLIELLQEKRSALIARTVTRGLPPAAAIEAGLDPHPKLKPSGVEWLGDVPAHWEVKPYKRICTRVDVGIAEAATHAYSDEGVPIIRSTNVRPNRIDTHDVLRIEEWFADKNHSKTLHAGDLLTVRTGYPGTTAVVPAAYDGSQCFTLIISTPNKGQNPHFYSFLLNSRVAATYFALEGWGSAQINISVPIVQEMPIVCPPAPEQAAIVEYLGCKLAEFDTLQVAVESAVDKLLEYRGALITAAVTGKIDVRGYVE